MLWYHIADADRSVIAVGDPAAAAYQLALTSLPQMFSASMIWMRFCRSQTRSTALLRNNIADATLPWGVEVERFEMKDVELPEAMQQVMAMQAEAIREKRAHIIKAEAELEASKKVCGRCRANGEQSGRSRAAADRKAANNSTTILNDSVRFCPADEQLYALSERARFTQKHNVTS